MMGGNNWFHVRQRYMVLFVVCLLTGCARREPPAPASTEEFVSCLQSALNSGNVESIANWIRWGDVPEKFQANYLKWIRTLTRHGKVSSIKCEPFNRQIGDTVFKDSQFAVEPEYWLHVELQGEKFSGYLDFALGRENGRLYILTTWPPPPGDSGDTNRN
jgi:hypothetical protein